MSWRASETRQPVCASTPQSVRTGRGADNVGISRIRHLHVDSQRRIWALGLATGGTTTFLGRYRVGIAAGATGPALALEKQVFNLTSLAGLQQGAHALYHPGAESIIILAQANETLYKFDLASASVVLTRPLPFAAHGNHRSYFDSTLADGTFFVEGLSAFARIRASDLAVLRVWTAAEWGLQLVSAAGGAYHPATNSLLRRWNGTRRHYLDRVGGAGAALDQVVSDLAGAAGLEAADLDVAALAGETVPGYLLGRPLSVRDALETLALAYLFDGVESDHQLRFVRRGGAAVATIQADHLGAGDAPLPPDRLARLTETRTQEDELSVRVEVHHLDRERDYQQGVQAARRVSLPAPTMHAQGVRAVELPLVLEAAEAKRLAEVLLFAAWVERTALAAAVPPRYLRLDPAGPVTIAAGAVTWAARLLRADLGANGVVALEAAAAAP